MGSSLTLCVAALCSSANNHYCLTPSHLLVPVVRLSLVTLLAPDCLDCPLDLRDSSQEDLGYLQVQGEDRMLLMGHPNHCRRSPKHHKKEFLVTALH